MEKFFDGLEAAHLATVFPICFGNVDKPQVLNFNVSRSKIFAKVLSGLLEQYAALAKTEKPANSSDVPEQIILLLALAASDATPDLSYFETLNLNQLQRHICDLSERNLVTISCPECRKASSPASVWKCGKSLSSTRSQDWHTSILPGIIMEKG